MPPPTIKLTVQPIEMQMPANNELAYILKTSLKVQPQISIIQFLNRYLHYQQEGYQAFRP